jgi:serine/threonine protein kinase
MSKVEGFPKIISGGIFDHRLSYIITERLGLPLSKIVKKTSTGRFSFKSAIQVGMQMLKRAENLHTKGFLYLNWSLDNILLRDNDTSSPLSSELYL